MLDRGYSADGVIPSRDLGEAVRRKLADRSGYRSRIFEGRFEDFPVAECRRSYDVACSARAFSTITPSFPADPPGDPEAGGLLLISDFFKDDAPRARPSIPARRRPSAAGVLRFDETTPFVLLKDEDITRRVSPTWSW